MGPMVIAIYADENYMLFGVDLLNGDLANYG